MDPPPALPAAARPSFEEELAEAPLWTIAFVIVGAFFALVLLRKLSSDPVLGRLGMSLIYTAALFLWVFWVSPHQGYRLRDLLGGLPRRADLAMVLGVVAANCGFGVALVELDRITGWPLAKPDHFEISSSGPGAIADIGNLVVFAVLLAPVVEELVFRGVLFRKWRRTLGPVKGLLLSSAIFGVLHVGTMLPVAIIGSSLALLYTSTRTFWAPLLAHVLNNALAITSILVSRSLGTSGDELNLTPVQSTLLLVASSAGLVAFGWRAVRTLDAPLPPFGAAPRPPLAAPADA